MAEIIKNEKGTTIGLLSEKDRGLIAEEPKPAKKKAAKKSKD